MKKPKAKAAKILIARHCWWCGRSADHPELKVLIQGPQHIHICDACVGVCFELLQKEGFTVQRVELPPDDGAAAQDDEATTANKRGTADGVK